MMDEKQTELIRELGKRVKSKDTTWGNAAKLFNYDQGTSLTGNALRKRYNRLANSKPKEELTPENKEFEKIVYNDKGDIQSVEACKLVEAQRGKKLTQEEVMEMLSINKNDFQLVFYQTSQWEQNSNEFGKTQLYAVKYKIVPTNKKELTQEQYMEIIKQSMKETIKPLVFTKTKEEKGLDKDKMIELPAIELHLGKLAWNGDTGQDYDQQIAKDRFRHIIQEVVETQEIHKAGTLFLTIGNDFFNSDTTENTTTKGTYQNNDLRWKKMFLVGLQLYKEAMITLRDKFDNIDVQLCQGNHDVMSSFYLYEALGQFFSEDDKIKFSDNLRTTQCYQFGKCAIFTSHGDANFKRLIKSIPAEFYEEWGQSIFRELHLGHLHKEMTVDDESGMITRRVGSPSGTDEWHYNSRYLGATQKQQVFIWNKENGLLDIKYVCFENDTKKKLLKLNK